MTKTKSHIIIGIDIGSQKTRLAVVEHIDTGNLREKVFPKILQLIEVETEGVFHGNVIDEKDVADSVWRAINSLHTDLQKNINHIIVSLNTAGISSIYNSASILNTNLTGEIGEQLIKSLEEEAEKGIAVSKNRKRIHTVPTKYKVDQNDIQGSPLHMSGKRLEGKFFFVSCPLLYFEKLENVFASLDLEVDDFVAGPFAECQLLLNKKEKMAGVALVNFGHSTTSILVYENNSPIMLSILPVGSNDITNDIALGLQISLEEAENVKCSRSPISVSKRRLEEIVEARISDICEKINLELSKINRKELLPGGVILNGAGSELLRSEYLFKYHLKLPVKFANEELSRRTGGQLIDTDYAKAVGLTYFAPVIGEEIVINKILKNFFDKFVNALKKLLP